MTCIFTYEFCADFLQRLQVYPFTKTKAQNSFLFYEKHISYTNDKEYILGLFKKQ